MSQQNHSRKERELSREPWPFSAAASLVSRLAAPASERVTRTKDGYGMKCSASFAKLDRAGLWRKTSGGFSQLSLLETGDISSEEFSATWPKMGIVSDGYAMELEMLGRRIKGKGCLLWRTPRASDGEGGVMEMREGVAGKYKLRDHAHPKNAHTWPTPHSTCSTGPGKQGRQGGENLQTAVMWPTPTTQEVEHPAAELTKTGRRKSRNGKSSHSLGLADSIKMWSTQKGQLNPAWVTLLMGFPPGWLDIDGLPAQAPSTPGNRPG